MHRSTIGVLASLFVLAVLPATQCLANLITNGDFETGSLSGWTATGAVTFVSAAQLQAIGGTGSFPTGAYAALFGSGNAPATGIMSQIVSTTAGTQYALNFTYGKDDSGAATQAVAISVANVGDNTSLFSQTISDSSGSFPFDISTIMDPYTFSFVATGSQTLIQFADASSGTDSTDGVLDNVSVAAVPEPSCFALICLAGTALFHRRSRNTVNSRDTRSITGSGNA
jgi:hypothetical protein